MSTIANNRIKLLLTPLILFGIVFISLALTVVFQIRSLEELSQIPFERSIIGFIESLILVYTYNYVVRKLNVKYPWKRNWLVRSLIDFSLATIFPVVIVIGISYALKAGWIPDDEAKQPYKIILFTMPLMISSLLLVIVEMIVATEERNQLEIQLANIEKQQINSKYTALKEQLDHHFLFNNLSVLSSLIYESTEKADQFIQDFSSIYRYVLSINKQDLVTVQEELDFIKTYLNLYKYRFEDGFNYNLKIEKNHTKHLIPPLSLQVVVENVFKHNVISQSKPLELLILNQDNMLVIKNNIQQKTEHIPSTQTGQRNLIEKYQLLHCTLPEFKIENGYYIAYIPLIQPSDD